MNEKTALLNHTDIGEIKSSEWIADDEEKNVLCECECVQVTIKITSNYVCLACIYIFGNLKVSSSLCQVIE